MRTVYSDLNIRVAVESSTFLVLNIAYEEFKNPIHKHSHGNNSYEIHYISKGRGQATIDNQTYDLGPNTLYTTGPHVEHEQIPDSKDPMAEYCIYFKMERKTPLTKKDSDTISYKFQSHAFWIGTDTQELLSLIRQLFYELSHKYTGYMIQVESLLQQLIVKMVRNYEKIKPSKVHFSPSNLMDSKYLIVEESFLYDYETISLEQLSKRLALSIRQTERFLKENYGKTFLQMKSNAKMSMAKIYLRNPSMSISEIADRLNYSSIQHFSYAFKQFYKISATEFRKESLQ